MSVVLARIDQRLIHGITVNQWNKELHPKRYMVVDDQVANDDLVKSGMRLSKPAGTGMSIISQEKAITNFKAGKYDDHKVFLLVKEPSTLLNLIKGGVQVPAINVGALFEQDGRVPYTKRVALSEAEVQTLEELSELGIPVSFQYTPDDSPVSLDKVLKKQK
ncbi:mannose/fructose/sorbose-specific PTS system IID component [Ligilactobacillus salitolerans]|uniref:Mannose/fructose/sorbose-specific PTS system IID component n=1 Tax=Ligilactobacillus salitolerans TaxID=1808352 RepID=A0A401IRB5_9LACO|nr:PTS sugar transporter subunit IIB [Ligilactobacillus salitolerans]GBG94066.1 mannose/fructose/sorbose-specific PTS system IID component [Ligilactobacillus salitolerans]